MLSARDWVSGALIVITSYVPRRVDCEMEEDLLRCRRHQGNCESSDIEGLARGVKAGGCGAAFETTTLTSFPELSIWGNGARSATSSREVRTGVDIGDGRGVANSRRRLDPKEDRKALEVSIAGQNSELYYLAELLDLPADVLYPKILFSSTAGLVNLKEVGKRETAILK